LWGAGEEEKQRERKLCEKYLSWLWSEEKVVYKKMAREMQCLLFARWTKVANNQRM
jgi:hypothetical protein